MRRPGCGVPDSSRPKPPGGPKPPRPPPAARAILLDRLAGGQALVAVQPAVGVLVELLDELAFLSHRSAGSESGGRSHLAVHGRGQALLVDRPLLVAVRLADESLGGPGGLIGRQPAVLVGVGQLEDPGRQEHPRAETARRTAAGPVVGAGGRPDAPVDRRPQVVEVDRALLFGGRRRGRTARRPWRPLRAKVGRPCWRRRPPGWAAPGTSPGRIRPVARRVPARRVPGDRPGPRRPGGPDGPRPASRMPRRPPGRPSRPRRRPSPIHRRFWTSMAPEERRDARSPICGFSQGYFTVSTSMGTDDLPGARTYRARESQGIPATLHDTRPGPGCASPSPPCRNCVTVEADLTDLTCRTPIPAAFDHPREIHPR